MVSPSPNKKSTFTLSPSSPLDGHCTIVDGASLFEVSPRSIVSVSPYQGNEKDFDAAIDRIFNNVYPSATNACEISGKNACILMPSSHSQWFLCFDDEVPDPEAKARNLLGRIISNQVAITDQSDAWVILALTGPLIYRTLERICPIDCSPRAMPIGTTARTVIQHLGAIILRRPDDNGNPCFWLMSARSSAISFLHVITSSPPFTSR